MGLALRLLTLGSSLAIPVGWDTLLLPGLAHGPILSVASSKQWNQSFTRSFTSPFLTWSISPTKCQAPNSEPLCIKSLTQGSPQQGAWVAFWLTIISIGNC
jgi:hypothetical protein